VDVRELAEALARGDEILVLDVREAHEIDRAPFPGALHVPLSELPARLAELPPAACLAVLCHHGTRSAMAVGWLRDQGRAEARNVHGGIDAWSVLVDPSVPRY